MYSHQQNLWEAYQSIYEPQELTEEVQISSQYFYEMGLNEDGVEILIDELGLSEFVEYVYDLAEEYYLTEDAASEAPPKPKRTRTRKKATPATQTTRQTAVDTAVKAQPKKRPVLDAIARAVTSGIERHNTAMRIAGETGRVAGKALGKAAGVLGHTAAGALGTAGLAHHVATRGLEPTPEPASEKPKPRTRRKPAAKQTSAESFDLFDTILEYLVAEGYADTNENALVIMANMSEEWRESIIEEVEQLDEISQKLATRAYAQSARGEFEGLDSDRDVKRTDNLRKHIQRKFGDDAAENADRHADAQTFGRKDPRTGKRQEKPQSRFQRPNKYRTTKDGKMHGQDQAKLKRKLEYRRTSRD
jgi:hypothetical protein